MRTRLLARALRPLAGRIFALSRASLTRLPLVRASRARMLREEGAFGTRGGGGEGSNPQWNGAKRVLHPMRQRTHQMHDYQDWGWLLLAAGRFDFSAKRRHRTLTGFGAWESSQLLTGGPRMCTVCSMHQIIGEKERGSLPGLSEDHLQGKVDEEDEKGQCGRKPTYPSQCGFCRLRLCRTHSSCDLQLDRSWLVQSAECCKQCMQLEASWRSLHHEHDARDNIKEGLQRKKQQQESARTAADGQCHVGRVGYHRLTRRQFQHGTNDTALEHNNDGPPVRRHLAVRRAQAG